MNIDELKNQLKNSINEISVYDFNSYTSIELYYKIANKVNEIIKELERHEILVSDEIIKQNNALQEMLNSGLHNEVVNKINLMVTDGTMDTIINTNVFNSLNDKIKEVDNKKDDKGFFVKVKKTDFIDTSDYTVDDYYSLYDDLVSKYTIMNSRNLGKDQSGTYDIKMYIYEPVSYNKTLFVICAIHGWEIFGAYYMYEFFKELLSEPSVNIKDDEIKYVVETIEEYFTNKYPKLVKYGYTSVNFDIDFFFMHNEYTEEKMEYYKKWKEQNL